LQVQRQVEISQPFLEKKTKLISLSLHDDGSLEHVQLIKTSSREHLLLILFMQTQKMLSVKFGD
jgi:hypothetical protein